VAWGVLPAPASPGAERRWKGGCNSYLAVGEGLVLVTGTHVSIVTDMAVAAQHR
jgi:hypothetical protein